MKVKLEMIHDSSNKLREVTRDDSFQELMNSLQTQGLLQPVKVRPNNNGYELIYGHRRTAAMRQLGWDECEVIIEDVDDQNALAQSLIENLHREDMTTLEEAMMYKRIQETGFTTNDIASSIGKSRAYVQSRV
ncbi:MAG: ParB/RepB/Spo0J family partition protein, partial [Aggregatilineales bacterium]